jgi:hypothetical protein
MGIKFLAAPTTEEFNQQKIIDTSIDVWTIDKVKFLQVLAEHCNITINYKVKHDIPISELLGVEVGVYNHMIPGLQIEYIETDLMYDHNDNNVVVRHYYQVDVSRIYFDFAMTFEDLRNHYYGMIPWSVYYTTGEVCEYARIIESN